VSETNAAHEEQGTQRQNPGWSNAQRTDEEKK
jgi:hypothetical protein